MKSKRLSFHIVEWGYLINDCFCLQATNIEGDIFLRKYLYSNSYAIVTVERAGISSLKLTQTSYNVNQTIVLDEPWNLQIAYVLPNNRNGAFIMNQVAQTVQLKDEIASNEWFKLNAGSTGYYIVNYKPADWKLLIDQLKQKSTLFSIKDRANILFDANQLSDKALLDYETLFNLLSYLKNENDFLPWSVGSSCISSIQSKLTSISSPLIVQYNAFIRDLISFVYDSKVDFTANPATMTYQQM